MDVHSFLNLEFTKRKEKNPRTSLRSFARLLEIDPTTLGRILKGQGVPSATSIERFADRLKLDASEKNDLLAAYKKTKAKQTEERSEKTFKQLPEDFFEQKYAWYFPVLIEYLTRSLPVTDPAQLATILNVKTEDIQQSIQSLIDVGLIAETSPAVYTKSQFGYALDDLQTSQKYQELQKKYLSMAERSITSEVSLPQHFSTLTLTLDELGAAEIIEALKNVRLRVSRMANKDKPTDGPIYNLCFALHLVNK